MAALMRCGRLLCRNLDRSLYKVVATQGYKLNISPIDLPSPINNVKFYAQMAYNKTLNLAEVNKTIDKGSVSRHLFANLISTFEEKAEVTENNVAMLLFICCSGPFDAPCNLRLEMTDEIWNRLEEFGVHPTTKLYNLKLKAYVANKKIFTPQDELAIMKSLGLNPDKVTYSLLIEGFNQNGDTTGANYVLEAMNDANLNIGIGTFNSFITGHLKSGSLQDADDTVEVMRSKGLIPNVETYVRYAEHFACEGDGDKVLEYINSAQKENLPMTQSTLMSLYRTMLQSGHETEARKIVPLLAEEFFQVNSMHRLCHLASEGFSDEALELYLTIPKLTARKDSPNAGCFLLHSMIINGKDAEAVVEMADRLLEANPSTTPHKFAVLYAYKYKLTDQALGILKLLSSKNHSLKIPHFTPAVCQYRDAGNLQGLYEATAMLMNTEMTDVFDFVPVLFRLCFPAFTQLGETRQDILTKMKDYEKQWNSFFLIEDLRNESFAVALENVAGRNLDANILQYLKGRGTLLTRNIPDEWESCIKLLAELMKHDKTFQRFLKSIVLNVLEMGNTDTAEEILKFIKNMNMRLYKEQISKKSTQKLTQPIQKMLLESLETPVKVTEKPLEVLSMKEMMTKSTEEVEAYVKKHPNYRLARVVLLNKHLQERDLPAAQQKLRELEASGFSFPRHQLLSLIPVLVSMGDVESAVFYMKNLKETSGTNYPDLLPLRIAVGLLKMENVEETLNMIHYASESQMPTLPGRDRSRQRMLSDLLFHAPSVEDAGRIHKSLVQLKGFLSHREAMLIHTNYMKKVLASDIDDEDFLQILEKLQQDYGVFQCVDQVLTRFIEKQKKSDLKRVIDLGVTVLGGNFFYHKLACNLVRCGMPMKASMIFQSLKDKINQKSILTSCQHFIKNKEVDCVESLVDITKTIPISRSLMLTQLIKAYVSVDDMDKAINVLQMFQDEHVIPPKSAVDFMHVAWKSRNIEPPELLKTLLAERLQLQETESGLQENSTDSSSSSDSESTDEVMEELERNIDVSSSLSSEDNAPENNKL